MNVVPRSARQLIQAVHEQNDLALARRTYYDQSLPVVDMLTKNNNPTGTIKAGVTARGVDVGIPRRPGSEICAADQETLATLVHHIGQFERGTQALLNCDC
jgi:dihydrodipicolinate synthase/N-acetylneuraminate lyase